MQESEQKIYYAVVTNAWVAFRTDCGEEEFSDEWWRIMINRFDCLREKYKDDECTKLLIDKLSQAFLDVHELRQKGEQ